MTDSLDRQVAEHVFGDPTRLLPYSTHVAAAWLVVNEMAARGWVFQLLQWPGHQAYAAFWPQSKPEGTSVLGSEARADTAAEAVCRAALAACSGEADTPTIVGG